jgi:hypothetical protein
VALRVENIIMKLTRIEDQSEIGAAYRSVFSLVTRGTNPQKAVVGYHSGNVSCRVAWNSQYGLWVMYTPKDWDNHLLVFGTQLRIPAKEIAHSDLMSIKIEASFRWTVIC